MVKKRRKIFWILSACAAVLIAAVGAVGAYAWYRSETEAKIVYVVPTNRSLMIRFDSSVTKNVNGTLYPAIVDEEAVADNAWNDPSRIVTEAGHVTFDAQFTMYGGTDIGKKGEGDGDNRYIDLTIGIAARIKDVENTRNLLETGELAVVADFFAGGTTVRLSGNRLFVPSVSGWQEVSEVGSEGIVAYFLNGECGTTTSEDYRRNPRGVPVVRDGKLVVSTDVAVNVKTEAYLTTPDVVTANDLKGGKTKIQIALSVRRAEESV